MHPLIKALRIALLTVGVLMALGGGVCGLALLTGPYVRDLQTVLLVIGLSGIPVVIGGLLVRAMLRRLRRRAPE